MTLIECLRKATGSWVAIDDDGVAWEYHRVPELQSDEKWQDYDETRDDWPSRIGLVTTPLAGEPKDWLIKIGDIKCL